MKQRTAWLLNQRIRIGLDNLALKHLACPTKSGWVVLLMPVTLSVWPHRRDRLYQWFDESVDSAIEGWIGPERPGRIRSVRAQVQTVDIPNYSRRRQTWWWKSAIAQKFCIDRGHVTINTLPDERTEVRIVLNLRPRRHKPLRRWSLYYEADVPVAA